jgi:hypothetical protein
MWLEGTRSRSTIDLARLRSSTGTAEPFPGPSLAHINSQLLRKALERTQIVLSFCYHGNDDDNDDGGAKIMSALF